VVTLLFASVRYRSGQVGYFDPLSTGVSELFHIDIGVLMFLDPTVQGC
jgi:hypothetical protein